MHCRDTGSRLPAIHFEHTDIKTIGKLNKMIGALKAAFNGTGRLTLTFSGGHLDDIEVQAKAPRDEKKAS